MPRALVLWGGWEGHQPEQQAAHAASLLRAHGWEVRVENGFSPLLDPANLENLTLIVPVCTSITLRDDEQEALSRVVQSGAGLAAWHGAATVTNSPLYSMLLGGQFVAHPGGMVRYDVEIVRRDHPITADLADFSMESEQYVVHVDPSDEVLAVTTTTDALPAMAGREMPVVWIRHWGDGRVFYSALGHSADELRMPEVERLLERGMMWAARQLP